jgi:lactoylglutathione lyase
MTRIRYWHAMLRISDPEATLRFFEILGVREIERMTNEEGRFTLIFLAVPGDEDRGQIELTHNWDEQGYEGGRNFGHLCFYTENLYETCQRLQDAGIVLNRPPRDGLLAFVRTPDNISIELVQKDRKPLPPQEPWQSMANVGTW